MIPNFKIMKKDVCIADVTMAIKPLVSIHSDHFMDVAICSRITDLQSLNDWFETRCFPRSRADANELLEMLGLSDYNPYELIKRSHGAMFDDFYWINFEHETLTWNDVNPRTLTQE